MKLVAPDHPALRTKSIEVVDRIHFEAARALFEDMIMLCSSLGGVGLAANQIGYTSRFFIWANPDKPDGLQRFELVVNPQILYRGTDVVGREEGCLSFPDKKVRVRRWKQIDVSYINSSGETVKLSLKKDAARIFQHEFDHLEGKCIV